MGKLVDAAHIAASASTPAQTPTVPWNKRRIGQHILHVDGAGRFLLSDHDLREDAESDQLTLHDRERLRECGLLVEDELGRLSHRLAVQRRRFQPGELDYLILVPTLRCNLACSYCQVSRAAEGASGYDWSDETRDAVIDLVRQTRARHLKIEFQGGEPTLRCDLIEAVIDAVPPHVEATFVICTNLQNVPPEAAGLFDRENVSISTSLDGSRDRHARQRGQNDVASEAFESNLARLLARYGPGKISALPTLDPHSPPDPDELIDAYARRGLTAIYLRPINYQGFARRQHADCRTTDTRWLEYHEAFIRRLIERNWKDRSICLEESYFSLLLRRIFRSGQDRHVDLRNPNPFGTDFIVIDHDGLAYPTDEARMLARAGIIDLSIGNIRQGWNTPARGGLNAVSTCDGDPDCEACTYKPFCGRDIVDDISRYGTIDIPRHETEFCRRHLHLFDLAFELIHSPDPAIQYSLCRWLGLGGDRLPAGGPS